MKEVFKMKLYVFLATFFLLYVIEAVNTSNDTDEAAPLDFTTDDYTTGVYDHTDESITAVVSPENENDVRIDNSTDTSNTTNSNSTNPITANNGTAQNASQPLNVTGTTQSIFESTTNLTEPINGTQFDNSTSPSSTSSTAQSTVAASTTASSILNNTNITESTNKPLSTASESSTTFVETTHLVINNTSPENTPTPAPPATSPPAEMPPSSSNSGGSESLAVGIAVPVLLIASLGLGFLCYKKLRKVSRGYITLDDFGTYEGMNNPNFEL